MKQSEFIQSQTKCWEKAEEALLSKQETFNFPATYRLLSHHLALAETRQYSNNLVEYLRQLVLQYHSRLYARKTNWFINLWRFYVSVFPVSVRENSALVWLSSALFFLPLAITAIFIFFYPDTAYYFISYEQLADVREMYNPDNRVLGRERAEDGDWYMFGFYLYNNTSIGFRTFAAGLLMGLGSAFLLLFNAVFIGVIAGYLINIGYSTTFFSFVSGHSSFELIAIALSGAAGFILGRALINPENYPRKKALQIAARKAMPVMQGAMTFFFIAALIEAFWSSISHISFVIKVTVGLVLWLLVLLYFFYAGKVKQI